MAKTACVGHHVEAVEENMLDAPILVCFPVKGPACFSSLELPLHYYIKDSSPFTSPTLGTGTATDTHHSLSKVDLCSNVQRSAPISAFSVPRSCFLSIYPTCCDEEISFSYCSVRFGASSHGDISTDIYVHAIKTSLIEYRNTDMNGGHVYSKPSIVSMQTRHVLS